MEVNSGLYTQSISGQYRRRSAGHFIPSFTVATRLHSLSTCTSASPGVLRDQEGDETTGPRSANRDQKSVTPTGLCSVPSASLLIFRAGCLPQLSPFSLLTSLWAALELEVALISENKHTALTNILHNNSAQQNGAPMATDDGDEFDGSSTRQRIGRSSHLRCPLDRFSFTCLLLLVTNHRPKTMITTA